MSQGLTESGLARGSFRAQWEGLADDALVLAQYFQHKVAPWLDAGASEFVSRLSPPSPVSSAPQAVKPLALAEIARSFHRRAGTLNEVAEHIERYVRSGVSLRVAHQPNFLASLNVVGQAAVCALLADEPAVGGEQVASPAQIFLVVDYDANTDRRYRHAKLPSLSSDTGYHSLSAPRIRRRDETFIFSETKPAEDFVTRIQRLLHAHSSQDLALIRDVGGPSEINRHELQRRQAAICGHLAYAFDKGLSLADANAIFISRYVNLVLGLPTIFVPGSEALREVEDHLNYLWSLSHCYRRACGKVARQFAEVGIVVSPSLVPPVSTAPFWLRCGKDSSRIAMYWTDDSCAVAEGTCPRCSDSARVRAQSIGGLLRDDEQPRLIPRVIWDDLLDGFAWGHFGGCSYRGGLEHYLFSAAVAEDIGLRPLPEFVSQCDEVRAPVAEFGHAAQLLAKQQRTQRGGARTALRLARSGESTLVHSLLWRPVNAADLAQSFSPRRLPPR